MLIRAYKDDDFIALTSLFYETVHSVNKRDYSEKELEAWAPKENDYSNLKEALNMNYALVAEIDGVIVGFGDISRSGYLDHLFVHKDYQKKGIASELCNQLEKGFSEIEVHASITALPFFLKRGYVAIKEQEVPLRGEKLRNYVMKKGPVSRPHNGES